MEDAVTRSAVRHELEAAVDAFVLALELLRAARAAGEARIAAD